MNPDVNIRFQRRKLSLESELWTNGVFINFLWSSWRKTFVSLQ